ncbi:hypothetical protein F511_39212 [Dorcoceras hygrometricum]|uniref:Uncharacterized protein n=1 Tax=Dorcoceras hygrometricum TaxID=472368 RepID=A0A2Z7D5F0_9LAMI|nr:hypothetical protein F511_39212 [Dorcoceras hygrometricum]
MFLRNLALFSRELFRRFSVVSGGCFARCEGERKYRTLIFPAGIVSTMRRVVNYHSSWARQQQVELFDASGNPGSTAGRGFNPAGGAPGGDYDTCWTYVCFVVCCFELIFIADAFVIERGLCTTVLHDVVLVANPAGASLYSQEVVLNGILSFGEKLLVANLIRLVLWDFDCIVGMEVLSSYRASVDCFHGIVRFRPQARSGTSTAMIPGRRFR